HRRVVGNAGTIVFGRMDSDELATPGYQVLSPATKIKLATLPVGELMVRHPHFTQPIFVRFPRPAALRGRDGVERFPPAADLAFGLTATGLLALGACRGGSGGPKVTLRYHPRAGTAYHYALDQQNTMSVEGGPMGALGEQAFRMRLFYTQTVVGPAQGAEGGVAVTVTFDSTAMEASGMGTGAMQPALDRMRGMTSNLVYDDRMRVISAAFTGPAGAPSPVTDQMASSLKSMAFPLPEGPVGVGDTWVTEHELPLGRLSPGQPIKSRTRLTVKEIRVAGADTSVLFVVETTVPEAPSGVSQQGPPLP